MYSVGKGPLDRQSFDDFGTLSFRVTLYPHWYHGLHQSGSYRHMGNVKTLYNAMNHAHAHSHSYTHTHSHIQAHLSLTQKHTYTHILSNRHNLQNLLTGRTVCLHMGQLYTRTHKHTPHIFVHRLTHTHIFCTPTHFT